MPRMGRDGHRAAAAELGHPSPLRQQLLVRRGMVERRHEVRLTRPHLQRQRALPRLRHERGWIEQEGDALSQPEADQTGRSQDDRVGLAVIELAQPGVDVAPQWHHLQIRAQLGEQPGPPH